MKRLLVLLASSAEWYEFTVYSFCAVYIGAAFFMGVPTVGMALLPSYATIGVLAPLLLIAFRILQGIAIGGQYSGSVVILVEAESTIAAKAKAGVSVVTSAFSGILLAIVTFQIIRYSISDLTMMNGGWRIFFGIAIILVVLSFFLKHSDDQEKPPKSNISLIRVIFKNYKSMVYMILLCFPGAVVAYFQI